MIAGISRAAVALLLVAGCTASGPEPIREGVDTCHRCAMIITDSRYAAEAVGGGDVRKYDSLDEMRLARPEGDLYVVDFPTRDLVPAAEATILEAPSIAAPMDGHAIAFADQTAARRFSAERKLERARIVSFEEWYRGR